MAGYVSVFHISMRLFCLITAAAVVHSATVHYDLGGNDWTVTNSTMGHPIAAEVPGQVHTDLLRAGVIGEPFNASNEQLQKWVALTSWTYAKTFDVPAALLSKEHVVLVSEGLDTVATLSLNGKHVLDSTNMFHRLRIDIKSLLRQSANTLVIEFGSKVKAANASANSCSADTSVICPYRYDNPAQHGWDNANFLRTEPCSFSWDWGPAFAPVGIWRAIGIEGFNGAVVRDLLVEANPVAATNAAFDAVPGVGDFRGFNAADKFSPEDRSDAAVIARAFSRTDREIDTDTWDVTVTVFLDAGVRDCPGAAIAPLVVGNLTTTGTVKVMVNGTNAISVKKNVSIRSGTEVKVQMHLESVQAAAWWPNGFGVQNLQHITATFVADDTATNADTSSSLTVRTGFRKVELVQDPLPGGRSFYFRINGVPVPVKGSNWIPADAFESRVNRSTLEPLFFGLRDSYQNMIRNWGGGIYQSEAFYDLADENGIMIWEDMMFACADYAVPAPFLRSVAKEVVDQTRRLQRRPSIVLWAGNNENENKKPTDLVNVKAYSDLYFRTVLANVSALDSTRPMTGSSPSNGNETADEPFAWDHQNEFFGDVHCYLYDVDNWDVTTFKRPRFMSEFGLQSWPSALTMRDVFPVEEQAWEAPMMTRRNHHPDGQMQILQQISMHFHLPAIPKPWHDQPPNQNAMYKSWSQFLWMSQLNQALGYKVEVEHFRRIRTECDSTTPGCNMGRMFWQTNDIWQGASWAAMDYKGRYKMVQYYAKHFYAPLLVSLYCVHWQDCHVYFVNDEPDRGIAQGLGRVELSLHSWAEGKVASWDVPFGAQPASATAIYNESLPALLTRAGERCGDATKCLLAARAFNGTQLVAQNTLLLAPMFDVTTMRPPELQATVRTRATEPWLDGSTPLPVFDVDLTAKAVPAAFVWLESTAAGHWSDNGFIMLEQNMTLRFYSRDANLTLQQLQNSLENKGNNILSLFDISTEYGKNNGWPKL